MADYDIFVSYAALLAKDNQLEAAEYMLGRAAYWQGQERPRARPKDISALTYHSDGAIYFRLAKSAIEQRNWNMAARVLVRWNSIYTSGWLSMSVERRNDLIHGQLDFSLPDGDLSNLNSEIDIMNRELEISQEPVDENF